MDVVINITPILEFTRLPADQMFLSVFFTVGWLPLFILYLYAARILWLYYIQMKWGGKQKYVFLAIDVPRGNEQSPKAVENIFSYLAGGHMTINFFERWWLGEWQVRFSLEVVSIEGYIQYIIRSPIKYRDLTEAAVYSQYPDAEITEINDYSKDPSLPERFPNENWDLNGGEFTYTNPMAFPIKTYRQFEVQSPGEDEAIFKDPNAALMALLSSLGPGEQIWYQILIQPIGFDWMGMADDEIKKIFGEAVNGKKGIFENLADMFLQMLHDLSEAIYELWGDIKDEEKKTEEKKPKTMIELNPAEKKKVEAIQEKVSKVAFNVKIRYIYLARKEVFNKGKAFGGFVGYMKQFIDLDLNSLKPDMEQTVTRAHYFYIESRRNSKKNNIYGGYRGRDGVIGKLPVIMNVEELATLWHFPLESAVKVPLLQKAPGRKAEAPMSLPVPAEARDEELSDFFVDIRPSFVSSSAKAVKGDGEEEKPELFETGGERPKARQAGEFSGQKRPDGHAPENLPFV
ncbi:MAG: hypothetical protein WC745_02830 [Patescibacteria group bacterium]|jgi:hypothetical protein